MLRLRRRRRRGRLLLWGVPGGGPVAAVMYKKYAQHMQIYRLH